MALQSGDIIHIFYGQTKPPKEKFIIILGYSDQKMQYLNVLINSKINKNIYKTEFQQQMCIEIKQEDYPFFLKRDSYIDLNSPYETDKSKIEWAVKNRPEALLGKLDPELLEQCKKLIHVNRILSGKACKQYGFFP